MTEPSGELDTLRGRVDLQGLAMTYEDVQKGRIAAAQRGQDAIAAGLLVLERQVARQLQAALRAHPIWPWLSQFPGLRGTHVAILISGIRDPHRFPGARYLWSYCGLAPGQRLRKGVKANWDPRLRRSLLMPDAGISSQIVRHRTPIYRAIYDAKKAELTRERAGLLDVIGEATGPFPNTAAETADRGAEIDMRAGRLRPIQIEKIARRVAVKAFVADLWTAWIRLAPAGSASEIESTRGRGETEEQVA